MIASAEARANLADNMNLHPRSLFLAAALAFTPVLCPAAPQPLPVEAFFAQHLPAGA